MIKAKQTRDKDGATYQLPILIFKDPFEAIGHLVKYELGYGGEIMGISAESVMIQTRVAGCIDTTIFEGPADEMKAILEFTRLYLEMGKKYEDIDYVSAQEWRLATTNIPDGATDMELFVSTIAPPVVYEDILKEAVMLAGGVGEHFKVGLAVEFDDLIAAIQLFREGLCSFREALTI